MEDEAQDSPESHWVRVLDRVMPFIMLAAALSACVSVSPDFDPTGVQLRSDAERVAEAARSFEAENHHFPERLADLAPDYFLTSSQLAIGYKRHDNSASVSYSYTSHSPIPRAVTCQSSVTRVHWICLHVP